MNTQKSFLLSAAPLFLVLFIDSMGLGLVFPILNTLVFDPSANFISADFNGTMRNLLYGVTISLYMFCWFFGAAFLGDLSDQIGRKKSLLICLIGATIGYLFSALAVVMTSYSLLLVGRFIAGFTAGSQSIAQAAIVDLSEPQHKARNLGLILFFCSLGFVFGPVVGGVLSAKSLVTWFDYSMPFYFAAAISFINAILLQLFFNESYQSTQKITYKLYYALSIFISAFKRENIRELSIIFLVMIFGWSGFYSFISMYLYHIYQFSALKNGFYMAFMGIGFGIATGFLINPLTKRISLNQSVMLGCVMAAVGIIWTMAAPSEWHVWAAVLLVSISVAIAYSTMLTLFSNQVDEASQGWVMGISGAISAFAFGVSGLMLGLLANMSPQAPMMITMCCFAIAAVLMKMIFSQAN